jgi:ethanolamine permease
MYILASAAEVDTSKYMVYPENNIYTNGITDFLPRLSIAGWWYFGMEIMPLLSDEVGDAAITVPRAIVSTAVTIAVLSFCIMVCAYAQAPGYLDDYMLAMDSLPLNSGFMNAFKISDREASILTLPLLYISNSLFIYGYGKQLRAMAKSKLLPSIFTRTIKDTNIPYVALIIGSIIGYVIMVIFHSNGIGYTSPITWNFWNACLMGSYFTFMVMFFSYIIFNVKYSNLHRKFRSPLGLAGGIYGVIAFCFFYSGLIGFSNDNYVGIQYFLVFIGVVSVYYFTYARYRQCFSTEEQAILLVVYVMKGKTSLLLFKLIW